MGRRQWRSRNNPPPPSGLEACQTQAQYSCRYLQVSDEIRVPPARRSRRPTGFLFNFLPQSYLFYGIPCLGGVQNSNSGRLRAQILETLCKSCSPGAQNSKSGHLKTQILDTLCKSCSLGPQNSNSGHLQAHPSSYSFPNNRSIRLNSSGSIHNMMISRGRR